MSLDFCSCHKGLTCKIYSGTFTLQLIISLEKYWLKIRSTIWLFASSLHQPIFKSPCSRNMSMRNIVTVTANQLYMKIQISTVSTQVVLNCILVLSAMLEFEPPNYLSDYTPLIKHNFCFISPTGPVMWTTNLPTPLEWLINTLFCQNPPRPVCCTEKGSVHFRSCGKSSL